MSAPITRTISRAMIVADAVFLVIAVTVLLIDRWPGSKRSQWMFLLIAGAITLVYAAVGSLIVSNHPRNTIGWIFSSAAFITALWGCFSAVATYVLRRNPGSPAGLTMAWLGNIWGAVPVSIGFVFLLFPDGRAPSRGWKRLGWALGICGAIAVLSFALTPDPQLNNMVDSGVNVANPLTVGTKAIMSTITGVAASATGILSALTVFAIRGRFKRGTPDERQQIRWLAAVGTTAGILFASMVAIALIPTPIQNGLPRAIFPVLLLLFVFTLALGFPAASTIAIMRYRLYDLDVVIKKTAIALVLTLFFGLIGIAIALLFGQRALWGGTPRGVTLAIGVAFGFLVIPLFQISRRFARRIVYGRLADPYDVLARFSGRVGESYDTEDVLARMAAILGEATGAEVARVWLLVSGSFVQQGTWPAGAEMRQPIRAPHDGLPDFGSHASVPVLDRGELLGALTLDLPANDPMTPAKQRLVDDLASQAGLVLRNVRLIEELRASRQRLVVAQDEERRKLERNLHDGAQQQLVALQVQLKLARQLLERDPEKTAAMLDALQGSTGAALDDLRDLARGIYPPLLADRGLAAALEAQARKAAVPVTVEADDASRYPQEIEAAVYFCSLEALNNVAKYASASNATVHLSRADGWLSFDVTDDGVGFDSLTTSYGTGLQGMADRLDAIGGTLHVESEPGRGTVVSGRVPVADRSAGA